MEVIIRNPQLPAAAGKAKIFFDEKLNEPQRKEGDIVLPLRQQSKYIPLQKGETFLFMVPPRQYSGGQWWQAYFGGTDEEPFLVQLQPQIYDHFTKNGEEGFLDALKPPLIKLAERLFWKGCRRQGDIFAAPTVFCHKTIQLFDALGRKDGKLGESRATGEWNVFKTRHILNGTLFDLEISGQSFSVGEGVIEAPDHEELKLDFPHILAQTAYLFDPSKAD